VSKFKVGDEVHFYGRKGTVLEINSDAVYLIEVYFHAGYRDYFTLDGKWRTTDDKPSLKKLKRKTKGKK
jgi:hypothetical protein